MAESLFPNLGSGGGSSSPNNALFSSKAGKVVHTPLPDGSGKFNCTADPRRGLITLSRAQDRTLHLKWTDRTTGSVEEDRIVFPNSITLKAVNTGRPIDRVACLTLDGVQQMLFWMQDKENKDAENMARLVELVNSPAAVEAVEAERAQARAAAAAAAGGAGGLPGTSGVGAEEWMRLMGLSRGGGGDAAPAPAPSAFDSLDLSAILASLAPTDGAAGAAAGVGGGSSSSGSSSGSGGSSSATPGLNASGPVAIDDLRRAMQGVGGGGSTPAAPAAAAGAAAGGSAAASGLSGLNFDALLAGAAQGQGQGVSHLQLQDIFTAENVLGTGALQDPAVRQTLIAHLPEGQQTDEMLEVCLRSPQLQDAMRSLSRALQGDGFNSILANLGLDAAAGGADLQRGDAVGAFLAALRATAAAGAAAAAASGAGGAGAGAGGGSSSSEGSGAGSGEGGDRMDT